MTTVLAVGAMAILIAGCVQPAASSGCDGAVPAVEQSFTPYGVMSGSPGAAPITAWLGEPVTPAAAMLSDVRPLLPDPRSVPALQLALQGPGQDMDDDGEREAELFLFYSSRPIGAKDTLADFLLAGGLYFEQRAGGRTTAEIVMSTVGSRAAAVAIGPHQGALLRGDPHPNGVRPYHLYWADGLRSLHLAYADDPARIVTVAQRLYCGGQ